MIKKAPLLELENMAKHYYNSTSLFGKHKSLVRAVDGVNLCINHGETLGLVGESGCGKSTLARVLLHLEKPTSGRIFFKGEEITKLQGENLRRFRSSIQMVFQDAYSSLNPRMKIGAVVKEPLDNFKSAAKNRDERVIQLLELVGLDKSYMGRFPHELSGGQRQRIAIARALALNPSLVICDEATANLDVSIQSQIINLLLALRKTLGLSYLFISHDLALVQHVSHRIAVMYLGKVVEVIDSSTLNKDTLHPYTKSLITSVFSIKNIDSKKSLDLVEGEPPSPIDIPMGCRFHPRCPNAMEKCKEAEPQLVQISKGHICACHLITG
ncbi:ABC transporter ATP-binding protein [Desulfitibacter alkalitolerans]|uniref:ABC transporter ATP-binding protein n=1 Tax=Desulfitibacter alkalitolerans TaxID=264641 RepID=UPI000485FB63|nr:ABC transporter ATP-binding protein [Desulfitibacter alkalitolerans]